MRHSSKKSRHEDERPSKKAKRAKGGSDAKEVGGKSKKARREEGGSHKSKGKGAAHAAKTGLTLAGPKAIAKEVRREAAAKGGAKKRSPFVALMVPMAIAPVDPEAKPVIADAGSVVEVLDQRVEYRDRVSPITYRGDEVFVRYGAGKKAQTGWIAKDHPAKAFKPVKGPTFLVTTKDTAAINPWDRLRFQIATARKNNPVVWFASWLATYGKSHLNELREVIKHLGGTPVKNEGFDARSTKLIALVLNTELDMSALKLKKGKKGKHAKEEVETKATKKSSKKAKAEKKAKPEKKAKGKSNGKVNDHVIRRLVKENPHRAGSTKYKVWDRLKKGMTVDDFIAKGGTRSRVNTYVENGWIKLLRPAGDSE